MVDLVVQALDVNALVRRVDLNEVIDQVDINKILAKVDVSALVDRVDMNEILAQVDVSALIDRVDLNEVLQRVDVGRLLDRVDLNDIVGRIDMDRIIERHNLGAVIARSSAGVTTEVLDAARSGAVGLDGFIDHWVGLVFWRKHPRPAAPQALRTAPRLTPRRHRDRPHAGPWLGHAAGQLRGLGVPVRRLRHRRRGQLGPVRAGPGRRFLRRDMS